MFERENFAQLLYMMPFLLTGELATPIGLHMSWNFMQGNVFGFAVSGTTTGTQLLDVNVTGLFYGNAYQFVLQIYGALFIIIFNAIATYIILKVISFIVPLRMDDAALKVGDDAVHGETAYAIGAEGE